MHAKSIPYSFKTWKGGMLMSIYNVGKMSPTSWCSDNDTTKPIEWSSNTPPSTALHMLPMSGARLILSSSPVPGRVRLIKLCQPGQVHQVSAQVSLQLPGSLIGQASQALADPDEILKIGKCFNPPDHSSLIWGRWGRGSSHHIQHANDWPREYVT